NGINYPSGSELPYEKSFSINWKGNVVGNPLSDGNYTLQVSAQDSDGKDLPVRILRENLQSIISVGELFARNFSLPVHGKRFFIRKFCAIRKIIAGFGALVPEFIIGINYFLPGFCNNNAYIYGGGQTVCRALSAGCRGRSHSPAHWRAGAGRAPLAA
ncbi:MAG: hypothetical protein KKH28_14885, partial [Elusimicrobia bacterium]|nr:hypothetical protein [Elusimicrobiota bacterium]